MRAIPVLCLLLATGLFVVAPVRADTVATFADPASDGTTPLFELDGTTVGGTLSGGWSATGLTLEVPMTGGVYSDATFTLTDLTVDSIVGPLRIMSGGTLEFFSSGGAEVLQIDFDEAQLYAPFVFGASDLVANGVTITGPGILTGLIEEQFAFSFANQVTTPTGYTWTAAFTSSAIPEPASLALLGLAVLALRRR